MGFVELNDGLFQQSRLGVHVYDRPVLMYHDGIVAMGQKLCQNPRIGRRSPVSLREMYETCFVIPEVRLEGGYLFGAHQRSSFSSIQSAKGPQVSL